MYREVFQKNRVKVLIIPLFITVGFTFFYLNAEMPLWTLFILIVPFVLANVGLKTRVIVEGGALHYESVFTRDKVDLKDVAQIVMREEVSGADSPGNREVIFVLDESGAILTSFSAKLIGRKNQRRFEEAVSTINAKINMS